MTTKRQVRYSRKGPGLFLRHYIRDGEEGGAVWVWKTRWEGKVREVIFGPQSLIPEKAAISWAATCAARKRAGWTLAQIKDDSADLVISLNDHRLALDLLDAKKLDPFAEAQYSAAVRARHGTVRDLAALTREGE